MRFIGSVRELSGQPTYIIMHVKCVIFSDNVGQGHIVICMKMGNEYPHYIFQLFAESPVKV